jgi:amidase
MQKTLAVAVLLVATAAAVAQAPRGRAIQPFTVVEAGIDGMRRALDQRRTTSRDIVQQYLTRIALYEDRLNAAIFVNPDALAEADVLDRERRQGRLRGRCTAFRSP